MSAGNWMKMVIAALVCIALVAGCNDGGPSTKIYVKKGDAGPRLRVAVLPFDNVSQDPDAGRIVTNTVVTYLLGTGYFDVVEPGVVYAAMGSTGVRTTEGMTPDASAKLQPLLATDIYVTGVVEEFGEVRIGADTYPAVSFSSRLLDSRTNQILWAGTISKTGAEGAKFFDIGRISSLSKLTQKAVQAMADSLRKSKALIMADAASTGAVPAANHGMGTVSPGTAPPVTGSGNGGNGGNGGAVTPAPTPAPTPTPAPATGDNASARFMNESAVFGEKEMTSVFQDIGDAKVGTIRYKKHFHDIAETEYQLGAGGKVFNVKLVDYKKTATAQKFIVQDSPAGQKGTFETLPSVTDTSMFGFYHLNIAAGRFGIYVEGPADQKGQVENIARGIIGFLR